MVEAIIRLVDWQLYIFYRVCQKIVLVSDWQIETLYNLRVRRTAIL